MKNQDYDPEVEKQAIEAEESYKRAHGHYREGSIYKKAQEEKTLGTKDNPIGEKNQYDPEIEKQAIEAEKKYKEKNGHYRQSSAWKGVRKDLNGNVIGQYNMRNSKK